MPETKEKRYKWRREGYKENTKGLLMVNTGDGKGKTTCALGLMMRAAGRVTLLLIFRVFSFFVMETARIN